MVCPNCHSDKIIQVQDQLFCINCGQQVPESAKKAQTHLGEPAKAGAKLSVQDNGLPTGVKVLPVPGVPKVESPAKMKEELKPKDGPRTPEGAVTIMPRRRISGADADPASAKRKPGRPKAGRLDTPVAIASNAPTPNTPPGTNAAADPKLETTDRPIAEPSSGTVPIITQPSEIGAHPAATPSGSATPASAPILPAAPKIAQPHKPHGPRRISDLSPRKNLDLEAKNEAKSGAKAESEAKPKEAATKQEGIGRQAEKHHSKRLFPKAPKRPHIHKVGVPPIHFGAVTKASLHSRAQPLYLGLSAGAAFALALAAGYGAWLYFNGGLHRLADQVVHSGPLSIAEAAVLALLYYVGRNVAQGAITYGVMRESDGRPISLQRQLSIGINSFPRRLALDIACGTLGLGLICATVLLVVAGGTEWPVNQEIQVAALFAAFLLILYLLTALAISRGLAGVALTLTAEEPLDAAKFGWHLFSHRFELLGLRFLALAFELVLSVPLLAAAVGLIAAAPPSLHALAAVAVGLIAWVAGALLGAGTAGWWASLYRQLVMADHPGDSASLLSAKQPTSPRPADLTLVVALTSFLLAAALALPWVKFTG